MRGEFRIQVASVPDRKRVVAEVWWDDTQVAEIRREPGEEARVQLYRAPNGEWWDLPPEEFVEAIRLALSSLE